MLITDIEHEVYYRYLPIPGWDNVRKILYYFTNGEARDFRATQRNQVQAMDEVHGVDALNLMAALEQLRPSPSAFVDRLLVEAAAGLQQRHQWSKYYDYDGFGPFFKTRVIIGLLEYRSQIYYLGLKAAYTGDQPEKKLAASLGIERTLSWSRVEAFLAPSGMDSFQVDFEDIVARLRAVLRIDKKVNGSVIAAAMMQGDPFSNAKPFIIFCDKALQVNVVPGAVEHRFVYPEPGKPVDTWQVKGGTLTGRLQESDEKPGTFSSPSFLVTVTGLQNDRYDHQLIWQPEEKKHALALSSKIQSVFQPY